MLPHVHPQNLKVFQHQNQLQEVSPSSHHFCARSRSHMVNEVVEAARSNAIILICVLNVVRGTSQRAWPEQCHYSWSSIHGDDTYRDQSASVNASVQPPPGDHTSSQCSQDPAGCRDDFKITFSSPAASSSLRRRGEGHPRGRDQYPRSKRWVATTGRSGWRAETQPPGSHS